MPKPLKNDPDRDLVLACQKSRGIGFQGAFRELYEQYKDRVYNVSYRITGNATDALDSSQETFGIIFRKIAEFRFESRFSSWVYRIAVNASIDLKRRSRSKGLASLDSIRGAVSDDETHLDFRDDRIEAPQATASRHELEEEIQDAILRLSPKMQKITVLRYTQALSYEQIAETLRISLGTVKSRLSRAHAALDRELSPVIDRHQIR